MPSANDIRAAMQVRRTKEREGRQPVTGTLKSKRSRTVPLPGWLTAHLADYLADTRPHGDTPTAPLWPSRKYGGGHRGRRPAVSGAFGLVAAVGNGHLLRHDHEACPGGNRLARQQACQNRGRRHANTSEPRRSAARPRPYVRGATALGGRSLYASVEMVGAQQLYPDVPEQDGGALNTLPESPAAAKPDTTPSNVLRLLGGRRVSCRRRWQQACDGMRLLDEVVDEPGHR